MDAILAATARILVKDGYEGASTNRVAQAAGVSVGSLYQYFPSKEALVAAVIDRHCEEMGALLESKVLELVAAPVPVAARELVKLVLDAHALDPKLHRVLLEQVPRVGKLANIRSVGDRVSRLLRAYLEPRQHELRPVDLDLALFLLVRTVEAVGHECALQERDPASHEQLVDEITRLIVRYLLPVDALEDPVRPPGRSSAGECTPRAARSGSAS